VLVCNEASRLNKEKLRYAAEKSIPVVSSQWLNDCVSQGVMVPLAEYTVSGVQERNILHNTFWHPVHNPRPKPKPRKGLSRQQPVEVMARGEGFAKHEELDSQQRASKNDSRAVQEPLQELRNEVNSPKKKLPPVELQKKPRPNMPFDDDDDEDDDNPQYQYQDDTINTFNDDETALQEVDDSIVQSEMLKPSSLTESSPPLTLPPMPTIPSFDASATISVPPPQQSNADPTPTQHTARLNYTLAELLNTHKARQHKQSELPNDTADPPPDVAATVNPNAGATDPATLIHLPSPAAAAAAPPRLRTYHKARTLGRAPSNPSSLLTRVSTTASTSSASAALSRPNSALAARQPSLGDRTDSENLDDLDAALFRPVRPDPDAALFRPSQALSYDNPEAGKAQREMARVFGQEIAGQMDGGGDEYERERQSQAKRRMRVEEIGVVRDKLDAEEEAGVTGGRKAKGSGARNTRSKRREKVGE